MRELYNRFSVFFAVLVSAVLLAPGCEVIGGIFKAGMWVGVIVVVLILALIFGIGRMFRK